MDNKTDNTAAGENGYSAVPPAEAKETPAPRGGRRTQRHERFRQGNRAIAFPWLDKIRHPKQRAMLAAYARTGNVLEAVQQSKVARSNHHLWMKENADYREAFREAYKLAIERMEAIVDRVAFKGLLRPIYHQGKKVGQIRVYNPTLMMFRLRRLDPAYRDTCSVEVAGPATKRYVGVDVDKV